MAEEETTRFIPNSWRRRHGLHDPRQRETLDTAVETLLSRMAPEDKLRLRNLPMGELNGLHMGLGMWIRNQLDLWLDEKSLWAATGKPERDGASAILLKALWLRLNISRDGMSGDAPAPVARQFPYPDLVGTRGHHSRLAWGENAIALARTGAIDALVLPSVSGFTTLNLTLDFLEEDLDISGPKILRWADWNRHENERVTLLALASRRPDSHLRGAILASGELTRGYARHATPYWGRAFRDFFYNVTYEALNHASHAWQSRRPGLCSLGADCAFDLDAALCHLEAAAHLLDQPTGPAMDALTFISPYCFEEGWVLWAYHEGAEDRAATAHRPIRVEIETKDAVTLMHLDWTSADHEGPSASDTSVSRQ